MKSEAVVLTGWGMPAEVSDAFYDAAGSPGWLVRSPPLDEACDDVLSTALAEKSGAVLLGPLQQLDSRVKRFLSGHRAIPVLLISVADSRQQENSLLKVLSSIYAQLAEIGISNVRVELAYYEQQQGFLKTDGLCEQLSIFCDAIAHFDRFPSAIFCTSRSALSKYVDSEDRLLEAKSSFQLLKNVVAVSSRITACKLDNSWDLRVQSIHSDRLDFEGSDLPIFIQEELKGADTCNALGCLSPLVVQECVGESVERWLRLIKIKSVCDLTLTIVCPDEVTRFYIQQSPVEIKVGEVGHER